MAGTARILLLASRTGPAKQPPPNVLAVAGASVFAFRKPDTTGEPFLLRTSAWVAQKDTENLVVLVECGRGLPACRTASVLSETAGARDETLSFFKSLIAWPA